MYNLTNLTGATGAGDVFVFADDVTGGILVLIIMLTVFFIVLLATLKFGFVKSIPAACFSTFVFTALMSYAGFISVYWAVIWLFGLIFSALLLFATE